MIKKIISGGQTGADQAALDLAIKLNIPHGGWVPKGRKTEAGVLSEKYQMTEMPTDDYRERTRQNIIDSHGTVIISRGPLTGGSKLTASYAKVIGRPHCVIDLTMAEEYEAAITLQSFILENAVAILNVAGPRLSGQPWIYREVQTVLETALFMLCSESTQYEKFIHLLPEAPEENTGVSSLEDAVDMIADECDLRTRALIANTRPDQIHMLYFAFQNYIKQRLGFDEGKSQSLLKAVDDTGRVIHMTPEDAAMIVIKALKSFLEPGHALRVVK